MKMDIEELQQRAREAAAGRARGGRRDYGLSSATDEVREKRKI
jgi:hypothetical protein